MILDDAETAAAIRRQPDVADAFALLRSVTMAVVAIGAWGPGLSTIFDAITPAERAAIADLGVCAEMAGTFLGVNGRPVQTALDSRMVVAPGRSWPGFRPSWPWPTAPPGARPRKRRCAAA